MLISVITATYNSASTIRNTINSVQSRICEIEHIIVDGASVDGTVEILKEYSNLKWISEPDMGVYDAFNKGVKMATGDWIYFLGSDDQLLPGAIDKISCLFENRMWDVIYGNVWVRKTANSYGGFFSIDKFLINNPCQQAIFYRKELFENSQFNLAYPVFADYAFNINLLQKESLRLKYVSLDIASYDGNGISERIIDKKFLCDKVSIFCRVLDKKRIDIFFDGYRHQEAINQILYGNVLLGWYEMLIHTFKRKAHLKNLRTALAMTKCRLF